MRWPGGTPEPYVAGTLIAARAAQGALGALMLPQVLHPGFRHEALDKARRVRCILEDFPVEGAIATPDCRAER